MVRNSRQLLKAPLLPSPFRKSTCDFWAEKGSSTEQQVVLEARWGSRGGGGGQGKALHAQLHMGDMGPGKAYITVFGAWLGRGSF